MKSTSGMTKLAVFALNKLSFIQLFALSNVALFVYMAYRFHSISAMLLFHYYLFSQRYKLSIFETMSSHKLTESFKAVQILRKKFRNEKVSLTNNTKTGWESEPMFMKHNLDNFWIKFNLLKTEHEEHEGNNAVCNLIF